jgi:hypothetical protein
VLVTEWRLRHLHWAMLLPAVHWHYEVKLHGNEYLEPTARVGHKTVNQMQPIHKKFLKLKSTTVQQVNSWYNLKSKYRSIYLTSLHSNLKINEFINRSLQKRSLRVSVFTVFKSPS